eukprot:705948-Rhodomonas_salina.1
MRRIASWNRCSPSALSSQIAHCSQLFKRKLSLQSLGVEVVLRRARVGVVPRELRLRARASTALGVVSLGGASSSDSFCGQAYSLQSTPPRHCVSSSALFKPISVFG